MGQVLSSIGKLAAVVEIKSHGDSAERKRLLVGELPLSSLPSKLELHLPTWG
jgi:hypothetical protein